MTESWRGHHPFALGQTVFAACDVPVTAAQVLAAGSAVVVCLRGCDAQGLWFATTALPGQRLAVRDFCQSRPLPPSLAEGEAA